MTDVTVIFDSAEPSLPANGTLWVDPALEAVGFRAPDISGSKWIDLSKPKSYLPSKPMRVVQQILHRMNFSLGNNPFVSGPSTSGGVLTDEGSSLPSGFDLEYPPSLTDGPVEYYGGVGTLDDWGIRFYTATASGVPGTMLNAAQAQFGLWGDAFGIQLEKPYASYRILVEEGGVDREIPVSDLPFTTTGSGDTLYLVQFPNRARRVITVETMGDFNSNNRYSGRIGSIWVKSETDRVFHVQRPALKMVFVGDSAYSQVQPTRMGTAMPYVIAAHMGIKDVKVTGVAGTGYIKAISDTVNFPARRSDWLDYEPDLAMFRMTENDAEFDNTDVIQAVLLEIKTLRAARPDCVIFVQELIVLPGDGPTSQRPVRNQLIRNAVAALRDPFVVTVSHGLAPYDYWVEQGTGYIGNEQHDGPRDVMVTATDHWSELGDLMVGIWCGHEMKAALEKIYYGNDRVEKVLQAATKVSTLLLLNGTSLTDESGRHTVAAYEGTPTFGGDMIRLDGATSLIVTDNLDDFKVEGPYTVEMQVEAAAVDAIANQVWLSTLNATADNNGYEVFSQAEGDGGAVAFYGDKGTYQIAGGGGSIHTGSKVDIALVNDDTQFRMYVGGNIYIAAGATMQSAAVPLLIGRESTASGKNPKGGLRLQITNAALYSGSSYTPAAWPRTPLI